MSQDLVASLPMPRFAERDMFRTQLRKNITPSKILKMAIYSGFTH